MSDDRHPGISMHKLPVGGGFVGLLFAMGSAVIFIVGFPTLWYFVALSFGLGLAIALILRFTRQRNPDRSNPLSILTASEQPVKSPAARAKSNGNFLHAVPSAPLSC
mgnify:CR=1 FL=1